MIEQWFLDLDGVRSGPYQTPEVMSLIAEGEVLPHHRISTSLREQHWITILDWRLNQAKVAQPSRIEAASMEDPHEKTQTREITQPMVTPPEAPVEIAKDQVQLEIEAMPTLSEIMQKVSKPQTSEQKTREIETPANFQEMRVELQNASKADTKSFEVHTRDATREIKRDANRDASKESTREIPREGTREIKRDQTREISRDKSVPPKAPPAATSNATNPAANNSENPPSNAKRDPTAEMFEMLQNTKQKREAKQVRETAGGISIEQDHGELISPKAGFGLGRTLLIGLGIVFVGFALGQIFQQSTPAPEGSTGATAPKPLNAGNAKSAQPAQPAAKTEVVDRSTDKMIIRSVVSNPTPPPPNKAYVKGNSGPPSPQTEKELEELRNLKKELQELKALKNGADETPDATSEAAAAAAAAEEARQEAGSNGPDPVTPGAVIQNNANGSTTTISEGVLTQPAAPQGAQTQPGVPPSGPNNEPAR